MSNPNDAIAGDTPCSSRTMADLLLDYLAQLDVGFVFGVPGKAIEPLFDALARRERLPEGRPRLVATRHETGAAFMADGYARESGRLGVCCATTGPGATNLITGVASAYAENIPMLVITPQTSLSRFGRHAFQESSADAVDTVSMLDHCTRYNSLVSHQSQFEHKLFAAFRAAFTHPRGPAHLSIPLDIFGMAIGLERRLFETKKFLCEDCLLCEGEVSLLAKLVAQARKPVLFLDRGALGAEREILAFAEKRGLPVVTAPCGKGCLPAGHPLFQGVFGFAGHPSARNALTDPEVDLVLAVGTPASEMATGNWDQEALLNNRLVHIDRNPENFIRTPMARLHVHGEPEKIFAALISQPDGDAAAYRKPTIAPMRPWSGDAGKPSGPVPLPLLMTHLAATCSPETRFYVDVGNAWAWAIQYLHPRMTNRFQMAMEFGAMGWGLSAAIGAALATRENPLVCITGDGSLLMAGQELTVAAAEKLPILVLVLNDSALGMVKHGQRLAGAEPIGFQLPKVDFAALARVLGAEGIRVESAADLMALDLEALCRRSGPVLLDVVVDPEEVPPLGDRVQALDQA